MPLDHEEDVWAYDAPIRWQPCRDGDLRLADVAWGAERTRNLMTDSAAQRRTGDRRR